MVALRSSYMSVRPGDTARDRWRDFDPILFATMLVLMGFGVLAIWSAIGLPPILTMNGGTQQALFGLFGIALLLITASIDYRFLNTLAWPLYGIGILSLVAVQVAGVTVGGARNWFQLGSFLVQPSEFAKITTIIALASFIASRGEDMKALSSFFTAGMIVALPMGLVLIGPDLGQATVYVALWATTMLVARTRMLYFFLIVGSLPVGVWAIWQFVLAEYQKTRFKVSYDPQIAPLDEGFQIIQARISIGAGGLLGEGLKGGSQSQNDLLPGIPQHRHECRPHAGRGDHLALRQLWRVITLVQPDHGGNSSEHPDASPEARVQTVVIMISHRRIAPPRTLRLLSSRKFSPALSPPCSA